MVGDIEKPRITAGGADLGRDPFTGRFVTGKTRSKIDDGKMTGNFGFFIDNHRHSPQACPQTCSGIPAACIALSRDQVSRIQRPHAAF